MMLPGSELHNRISMMGKARSPSVEHRVARRANVAATYSLTDRSCSLLFTGKG